MGERDYKFWRDEVKRLSEAVEAHQAKRATLEAELVALQSQRDLQVFAGSFALRQTS